MVDINEINEALDKLDKIENKLCTTQSQNNFCIESQTKEIATHHEILDTVCGDCIGPVKTLYNIDDSHEKIAKWEAELTSIAQKLETVASKRQKLEKNKKILEKQLEEKRVAEELAKESLRLAEETKLAEQRAVEEAERQRKFEEQQKELERKKKLLEKREKCSKVKNKLDKLKLVRDSAVDKLGTISDRVKEVTKQVSPFTNMIAETEQALGDNNRKLNVHHTDMKYNKIIQHLASEEGVKHQILQEIIEKLNKLIQKYLLKMGTNYICSFDSNFKTEFLTDSGECSYENFSSGEQTRINLSALMAFMELHGIVGGFNSNILNIDEFLDQNLADDAINPILDILKDMIKTGHKDQINIISHKYINSADHFDRRLTIVKEDGQSSIEITNN